MGDLSFIFFQKTSENEKKDFTEKAEKFEKTEKPDSAMKSTFFVFYHFPVAKRTS
ncbi:MAG TPA: hypothetical protein VNK70_02005 [Candidatus Paceibacterota bacterium]|nr:hypothetical protein [Candidatus Paceibacterota bacterium]